MQNALLWNLMLTSVAAIVLTLVCRLPFLGRRPAVRHTLWMLLLAKLVTPPLIPIPVLPIGEREHETAIAVGALEPTGDSPSSSLGDGESFSPITAQTPSPQIGESEVRVAGEAVPIAVGDASPIQYLDILLALSFAGTLTLLVYHGIQAASLSRWLARAGAESDLLARCCSEVAARLGIQAMVRCCVVDTRTAPFLWGLRRPIVAMPCRLVQELNPEQIRSIVAHELAHAMRRDQWSNLFAFLVKAVMWWNPVAWWAHRELRAAQELCCDALAIDVCNRRCYAATLLQALEFVQTRPPAHRELSLGIGAKTSLLRRFEMIADTRLTHRLPRPVLVMLLIATLPLLGIPVSGQEETPAAVSAADSAAVTRKHADAPRVQPATSASRQELAVGEHPVALVLVGIVWQRTPTHDEDQLVAWLTDRTTANRTILHRGSAFQVGRTSAIVEDIKKDAVVLKVNDKRRKWKLGTNFAALLDEEADADESGDPDDDEKRRIQVQFEVLQDPELMIIRGKPEEVEKVADLLRQLGKSPLKPSPTAKLEAYSLGEIDPQTALAVLQTLLAGRPNVRMTVDPKVGNLIVLGSSNDHAAVRDALQQMRRGARPAAKTPSQIRPVADADGKLRAVFRHQPWKDVLKWYAEQVGLNLAMDVAVPGTLNYTDDRIYTPAQSLDLLNRILLLKGYTLMRRDRLLFVVNVEEGVPPELATRVAAGELDQHGDYEFVSVLFPLGRRDAERVRAEIKPLLDRGGRAEVLPQTRQLLITARAGSLRRIKTVIESMPEPKR